MPGVNAADIEVWVGFQVTQLAGLLKDRFIGQSGQLHPGKDVVAGAVHDTHHALDAVRGKTFGQGLDDRNAPGDGGLEADDGAFRLGRLGQGLAMMGQERLVGRDHVLASGDRGFGRGKGRAILAAHHLDKHINVIAAGKGDGVRLPSIGG